MTKTKIFTATSYQKLEKDMNEFFEEFTNAHVLHSNFHSYTDASGDEQFFSLIIYSIDNEGAKFGQA